MTESRWVNVCECVRVNPCGWEREREKERGGKGGGSFKLTNSPVFCCFLHLLVETRYKRRVRAFTFSLFFSMCHTSTHAQTLSPSQDSLTLTFYLTRKETLLTHLHISFPIHLKRRAHTHSFWDTRKNCHSHTHRLSHVHPPTPTHASSPPSLRGLPPLSLSFYLLSWCERRLCISDETIFYV